MKAIDVYIPNLPHRVDRSLSIMEQFAGRKEFNPHIITPIRHKSAVRSLWETFVECVREEQAKDSLYFIFCEDDHHFTPFYNFSVLEEAIARAQESHADLLSGGMSWVGLPVQMPFRHIFCVDRFTGMQFTVLFRQSYTKILAAADNSGDATDIYLSKILDRKMVMFPFVSIQQEFGYSDVTPLNNTPQRVDSLFLKTEGILRILDKVRGHFRQLEGRIPLDISKEVVEDFQIVTHIIHLPERQERELLLCSQYADRKEFNIASIKACRHKRGATGLWQSICQAVLHGKLSGEDAILICEDDHIFTESYEKRKFIQFVYQAGAYGANLLSGGIGGFSNAVRVVEGLHWVDWLWCTQFIVIYSNAYDIILQADFRETDVADEFLSKILPNKMVIYPFISRQWDFGCSDVTPVNNEKGRISGYFQEAERKMFRLSAMETADVMQENTIWREGIHIPFGDYDRLNIGCGEHVKEGWLNVDLLPCKGAYYLDASQPFPFADESFRYVFSEHLFEHLSYEGGKNMLHEVYRILRPGGILRLAMPTMDFLQKLLETPEDRKTREYVNWSLSHYNPEIHKEFPSETACDAVSIVVNRFIHQWGHQMVYGVRALRSLLYHAGFSVVREVQIGESEIKELQNLEEHGKVIPDWANRMETTVMEAVK